MHSIDVAEWRAFLFLHAWIWPGGGGVNGILTGETAEMEVFNTPMCLSRAAAMCEIAVPLRRQCRSDNQRHLLCRK